MLFSNKNIQLKTIKMGANDIRFVDNTKFLGVFIDRKLTWTEHVEKVIQKINRNMNLLKLSNKFLNVHAKRLIYFAQIQSHLMYGLSVWGNMISNGTVEKLQKLQNRCLGYINGKNADMVNYHKLNILRIKDLIALENYKYGCHQLLLSGETQYQSNLSSYLVSSWSKSLSISGGDSSCSWVLVHAL